MYRIYATYFGVRARKAVSKCGILGSVKPPPVADLCRCFYSLHLEGSLIKNLETMIDLNGISSTIATSKPANTIWHKAHKCPNLKYKKFNDYSKLPQLNL